MIKEMIVFYVPEELYFDRMGTDKAYVIAHDGQKPYSSFTDDLPKTYEDVKVFLKNSHLILTQDDNALGRLTTLMMAFNKNKDKTLFDFKDGEEVSFGMGNIGVSLGNIKVIVQDTV